MTRDDTTMILGILKTSYPNFYKDMSKKEMLNTIDLWYEMFANDEVTIVKVAVKELIQTLKFPPTIADIKQKVYDLTTEVKTPTELWDCMQKALSNSIYHAQEMFEQLPEECKKFARSSSQLKEMAMMDSDVVHSVIKGQFLKQIEIIQAREKEEKQMLPESKRIREMALQIGKDVNMLGE